MGVISQHVRLSATLRRTSRSTPSTLPDGSSTRSTIRVVNVNSWATECLLVPTDLDGTLTTLTASRLMILFPSATDTTRNSTALTHVHMASQRRNSQDQRNQKAFKACRSRISSANNSLN